MSIDNCGAFIPNYYDKKCSAIRDTCLVISKECEDYGVDECPKVVDPEFNCLPDVDKNMCASKKCEVYQALNAINIQVLKAKKNVFLKGENADKNL